MKKSLYLMGITFSIVLNIVFVSVWCVHLFKTPKKIATSLENVELSFSQPCPMYQKLGVTEQQWQQMQPLLKKFSESSKSVNDSIALYRSRLIELLAEDTVDTVTLVNVQEQILRMQEQLQNMVIEYILSEKNIFNFEQRGQLFYLLRTSGLSQPDAACYQQSSGQNSAIENCKIIEAHR